MRKTYSAKFYLTAAVALLAFLVYLPALRNEFVYWDDNRYIFENPYIRSLDASFFRWAFLGFHVSNWHPLTWISHALDYAVWGLNPLGHHLTSIILHAVNTALVVVLALKLFETVRERTQQNAAASFLNDRTTLIAAGITGLLFGIHPVHVESVAWVAERKDLLCSLFFLLSILSYVRYAKDQGAGVGVEDLGDRRQESGVGSRESEVGNQKSGVRGQKPADSGNAKAGPQKSFINKHYLLSLGFFVLALMSKPMAVSLSLVLLLLDWYPLGRIGSGKTFRTSLVEKLPFFSLSLASSIIAIIAQKAGGALSSIDKVPMSIRVPVAAEALVAYLGKMLVPIDLIPFYPYPSNVSLFSFKYFLAFGLVIGITATGLVLVKRQKFWFSAWGYYVLTLLPVLGIIQVGGQSMADRYTYLPSIGPFLLAGLCVAWMEKKMNAVESTALFMKAFSVVVALLLVISLSYITIAQIAVWRDSIGLWTYVIEKEPERVPIAYNNRGLVYYKAGQFDRAVADFHKAVTLRSSYIDAYSNLGMAFFKTGRFDEAIQTFDTALALDPANYKAYNNRALVFGAMGNFDKAVADYNRVIALKPSSPQAYYNLGALNAQNGLFDQAIKYFSQSIAVDPEYADAYNNRGTLYWKFGRNDLALADFQKACNLGNEGGCGLANTLTQGSRQDVPHPRARAR